MGIDEIAKEVDRQGLDLSVYGKPRLKWTPQLHERFVDAVSQLGGADKATPRSMMSTMGIPGLTLYHLKSHLQKYRLAGSQDHVSTTGCGLASIERPANYGVACSEVGRIQPQLDISMLQMQMDVHRKLEEQIEVQKHLQLRIEAQGKYLQSVLKKAQETLAGYSSCMSNSSSGCSSFATRRTQHADCSTDSCLTSIESSEIKRGKRAKLDSGYSYDWSSEGSDEINQNSSTAIEIQPSDQRKEMNRKSCVERPDYGMRFLHQMRHEDREVIDLNRHTKIDAKSRNL